MYTLCYDLAHSGSKIMKIRTGLIADPRFRNHLNPEGDFVGAWAEDWDDFGKNFIRIINMMPICVLHKTLLVPNFLAIASALKV